MVEVVVIVRSDVGLHARPAALLVQEASKYQSAITIHCGERSGNAKSILGVLGVGAGRDAQITIRVEGTDEAQALAGLKSLVENNFWEVIPNG
jgi:phosphocarrier protein